MNLKRTLRALVPLIIFILIALFLFLHFRPGDVGDRVRVIIDGVSAGEYPLSKDALYTLNGGTNILRIEGGKARMEEADCPDGICIKEGWIYRSGECITCLPNRVVVEVLKSDDTVDLVV